MARLESVDCDRDDVRTDGGLVVSERLARIEEKLAGMEVLFTSKFGRIESVLGGSKCADININSSTTSLRNVNKSTQTTPVNSERDEAPTNKEPAAQQCGKLKDKRRILFIGDDQCRGATDLLQDYDKVNFQIETLIKPNALFGDIVNNIKQMARDFNNKDFVVIFAGTYDVLRMNEVDVGIIHNLKTDLKHTNVYITSVPTINIKPEYSNHVKKFNNIMREVIDDINCENFTFFDIGKYMREADICSHNVLLTVAERRRVIFYLYKALSTRMRQLKIDTSLHTAPTLSVRGAVAECDPVPARGGGGSLLSVATDIDDEDENLLGGAFLCDRGTLTAEKS